MKGFSYYNDKPVEVFKEDLFKKLGIQDNPKREKLFDVAWNFGHSYGYYEVYNVAVELLELIEL